MEKRYLGKEQLVVRACIHRAADAGDAASFSGVMERWGNAGACRGLTASLLTLLKSFTPE